MMTSRKCVSALSARGRRGSTYGLVLAVFGLLTLNTASADIVAFWDFSENGGSTLGDVSTNGLDGTIYGSPSWVDGHLGGVYGDYALQFTGATTKYVEVLDNALLHIGSGNAPFTIGMWVQDSGSGYGEAFCWGTGVRNIFWQTGNFSQGVSYLWSDSNGGLQVGLAGLGSTAWHHIAITADSTNIMFYVDADLKNTFAQPNITAWGNLTIGKGGNNVQPWNGKLSDLLILDVSATASNIVEIMNGIYPGMPPLPAPPGGDGVWTNPVSGGVWSDTSNWASGAVANVGNADFGSVDILSNNTVHLDAPYTIQNLWFGDTGTNSAAGWILDNNGAASNVLTLTGHVTVTNLGAGANVTISATIAGVNGLTKAGPGDLVVITNSYSGNTSLNGGQLRVSQLPANTTLSFGGGGLEYAGDVSPGGIFALSGISNYFINVTGAGGLSVWRDVGGYKLLSKGGPGEITLANAGPQDGGDLRVSGGTAVLLGTSSAPWWYANVASVQDVAPGATLKLGNSNGGQVYYDFSITMSGGTFDVNGQNPEQGQNGSVPAIAGSGTISNSATSTTGTAVFKINGSKTFSGNILDGAGDAKLALTLAASGGATPTWTLSGSNTYSGATTVNAGTLKAGTNTAFSANSAYSVGAAGTLALAGHTNAIRALGGAGKVTLGGGDLTISGDSTNTPAFSGVISGFGKIVKSGAGTLTLSGVNTYTGDMQVVSGTLRLDQPSLPEATVLRVSAGALVDLSLVGSNTVNSLYLNSVLQPTGIWGASGSTATRINDLYFTGGGTLNVLNGAPLNASVIILK